MDLSYLNNKNGRASIVKRATVTRHDLTTIRNCPKWLSAHARRPETRHNRDVCETQTYLFRVSVEFPLWGDGVSRGDL